VVEGPPQQKARTGPVDTTSSTGGYDFYIHRNVNASVLVYEKITETGAEVKQNNDEIGCFFRNDANQR